MEYDLAAEIEATKLEFRRRWGLKWQETRCREYNLYTTEIDMYGHTREVLDLNRAPEPPWNEYGKDPEFIGIRWATGFAVITADAFAKMPQSKLKILTGGKR